MSRIGRNYYAIIAEGHTPANTAGLVDLSPQHVVQKSELISAIFIAPVTGVAGILTITFAGAYAVGDFIRVTITSNLTSAQVWLKSYTHTVQAGATTVTDVADAFSALISADVSSTSPYASAANVAGVLTVTQFGDDKRGLIGYVFTDSAAGTVVNVPTPTVVSEGQPDDLVDRGIDVDDINNATFDTVRIDLRSEAAIPFIDAIGAVTREIYWYGDTGEGQNLADLINADSSIVNIGTAATGVLAVELGDSSNHVTELDISTVLGAIAGGADLGLGIPLYTFPAGVINQKAASINVDFDELDGNVTADTPELGLGTTVAAGAVAVLGGTPAFENIHTGTAMADCNGTPLVSTLATSLVINAAGDHVVYLNTADGWAAGGEAAMPVTGKVTLEWTFIG